MAAKDNYTFIKVPKDPWCPSNTGKEFTVRQLDTAVRNPQNKYLSHVIKELGLRSSGFVSKFIRTKIIQYGFVRHTLRWKRPVLSTKSNIGNWPTSNDKVDATRLKPVFRPLLSDLIAQHLPPNTITAGSTGFKNAARNTRMYTVDKVKLEKSARLFLEAIGEDIHRDGLKETPKRYANYMADIMGGKFIDTTIHQKDFENDGNYDGPVVVTNMPFYTVCEHHLAPFIGTWDFAYKPSDRILGLSKVVRLAREFQKQPQVQERLTQQIAQKMFDVLKPEWVVVRMGAEHFCMSTRGVRTPGAKTYTRKEITKDASWRSPFDILPIPSGV